MKLTSIVVMAMALMLGCTHVQDDYESDLGNNSARLNVESDEQSGPDDADSVTCNKGVFQGDVCYDEDYVLNCPVSELVLLEGYTEVTGLLAIDGMDVVDLGSLYCLEKVGHLVIHENPLLKTLDGLENLVSVDGFVEIMRLDSLQNIDALDSLATVGELIIEDVPLLENLDGLTNLKAVGEGFELRSLPALTDLNGIENSLTEAGWVVIKGNELLSTCEATDLADSLNIANYADNVCINGNLADGCADHCAP